MKTHDNVTVLSSRGAEALLHDNLSTLDHEEVWCIYLTCQCNVIGAEMVSKGTLDKTAIDCRTVMRQVLLNNAGALVILHNHPGGSARPSRADIQFTADLERACAIMGIRFVDHIIVARDAFYSFSDEKTIKVIK